MSLAAGADTAVGVPSNAATVQELPQVTVIGNTPLGGLGLPMNEIPSNVQTGDSKDMQRQQTLDLADYLNRNFSGVNVSESANNPFQLDVNYHGFTASPLLGTPEGLSVFVDGVRVNESFGDTVNWDLIPQSAISTVTLMSGSNPVFGLNTLGGALSIKTKSGHDDPGSELQASGGSFGRRSVEAASGGVLGNFDYFVTGTYFDETGWRDNSPTRVYQAFGKVGWQNDKTDVDVSYAFARTRLYGNGATPTGLLGYRRQASYTPDFTANALSFFNLTGTQFLTDQLLFSGNAYYRHLITGATNGNINDNYLAAFPGLPVDCTMEPASRAALSYCSPGQYASSRLRQRTEGFGLQLTESRGIGGWTNQAILGVDYSDSNDTFSQAYLFGQLTPDRHLIYQPSPFNHETVISLTGSNKIYGIYATDALSPSSLLHLTLSLRYNRSTETLQGYSIHTDIGEFGAGFDQAAALVGDHTFSRVNPDFGFTVTPNDTLTLYADYNQASRAPTVIELGCANPVAPCGLPNVFASDPNLLQVVARTTEVGIRSNQNPRLTWSADVFRTVNRNDIQFVSTGTNAGYFDNVGDTRRQGMDLSLSGRQGGWNWHLTYSLVEATFQSTFAVSSRSNSTADATGTIVVRPGDRIPLVPTHTGRLLLDYQFGEHWNIGGNLLAASGAYLHGNENNANHIGGTNGQGNSILGTGWIAGYTVVSLQSTYHLTKRADILARLTNLFDKQFSSAGFLNTSSFSANGAFIPDPNHRPHENAEAPAAPRAIWVGVRVRWE